jgi:hypothetical protein
MNIQGLLNDALNGETIRRMSETIGADETTTSNAAQSALPVMLGALAQQGATQEGASSLLNVLDRDHDGSVLDDVLGFLGDYGSGSGQGILGHLFGERLGAVQAGVGQASGLNAGQAGQLLLMLAPLVMGAVGRARQHQEVDASSLGGFLGAASQQMGGSGSVGGMLSQLLDRDRDGSALDDVMRLAGNLFGDRK